MPGFVLPNRRPAIMGILNVTPDSFSDGGLFFEPICAVEQGLRMSQEGADIVDVGGESTRPGAEPVSISDELQRVIPVIEQLVREGVPCSIDTMKPEVADAALSIGACVLNDVSGLRNPEMIRVAAVHQATVCIMHMQGEPRTMQRSPQYDDVCKEVLDELLKQAAIAETGGVKDIWIDPGIGFGKTLEHNLTLLQNLTQFTRTYYPVLLGASRKSFLGKLLANNGEPAGADERLNGTLAVSVWAASMKVAVLRVHDVRENREAVTVAQAILRGTAEDS